MPISKAVITAAGRRQRTLPLQVLIDRDGVEKSVLNILLDEVVAAGIDTICLVVRPGDERAYAQVAGPHAGRLEFVHQEEPLGHGHAVYCAREFVGRDPFLHLVGDHLYVSHSAINCAQALVAVAEAEAGEMTLITRHQRPVAQLGPPSPAHVHRGVRVGHGRIERATRRGTRGRYLTALLEDRGNR